MAAAIVARSPLATLRRIGAAERPDVGGIAAPVQRIEEPAVPQAVVASRGRDIFGALSLALWCGWRLSAMPTCASRTFARSTGIAWPCESSTW